MTERQAAALNFPYAMAGEVQDKHWKDLKIDGRSLSTILTVNK